MSISTHLKDCKVVLEDISFSCGAAKLQMLDLSQDKTHMTDSHHTTESDFLKNLCLKTPIAWGNSIDERWTQLDEKVSNKLHMCANLAETVSILHLQPKKRNLAGQIDELSSPLNLFNKRTGFWLKFNQLLCQSNNWLEPSIQKG